jgi:hypothetical protein
MNTDRTVLGCMIGVLALIMYRDFKTPDSTWPLGPVPPPYRFTYAGVIFGILFLVADIWSPRIAGVVALGVLIGTMFSVTSGQSATAGLKSNAPGYKAGGTASANPAASNGITGTTPTGNSGGSMAV